MLRLERLVAKPVQDLRQERHDVPAGKRERLRECDHRTVAREAARNDPRGGFGSARGDRDAAALPAILAGLKETESAGFDGLEDETLA